MKELKFILSYTKPYKKDFVLAILCIVAETGFELVIPMIMADIIDVGIVSGDIHRITVKGIEMSVCALLALFTGLLYAHFISRAANGFGAHLKKRNMKKFRPMHFPIWIVLRVPL